MTSLLTILASLLTLLLIPEEALAWGPATHLEYGSAVLDNLKFVAPHVRELLRKYPYDYLYGNISADIVVGKNLMEEIKHCHNWRFGKRLLKRAESDSQRAFTYGYLSHLAADTIAHNHFVPEMMVRSFSTRSLRHIYWELRFDAFVDKKIWGIPKKIVKKVHLDNDRLLDSTLHKTPLSFKTNKRIFSSAMSIQRVNSWHKMMNHLSSRSKWVLHKDDREHFYNLAMDQIFDLLNHEGDAGCMSKDPTGKHSLDIAKHTRKRLKGILKDGGDWEHELDKALKKVAFKG